jgi:hypothetical protein
VAKLWDKYLVQRRDGSVPEWPYFVIAASDPAAPNALRAYANDAQFHGMGKEYYEDVLKLAERFEQWLQENGAGDPDAANHRKDDPTVVSKIQDRASRP